MFLSLRFLLRYGTDQRMVSAYVTVGYFEYAVIRSVALDFVRRR